MGLLNIIRRMALREKQSIREISRRTGLSRNTIAKYLNAGTIEPTFTVPERPSKLDPFADKLAAWLKTEAGKSRKQRRTLKQVHADLVALGFTGSYGRVAAFARDWRADRQREQQTTGRGIFVPLSFRPGEAFQFDWSEDYAVIGGERTKLQVAHIKLSHSRAFLVRAYLLQTHEMLFDAHWHGFRVFGGVPARGIYDNMKTAVDRVGRGKERQVNIRFLAMTNHYVFAPEFCNPAAGWEKGQVEKNVQDSRPRLWQQMPGFENIDFRAARGLDRNLFLKLSGCDWIRQHHSLLLIGPAGVGKSWLACALGHKACREDLSVAYHRVPRLFAALALARGDGRYTRLIKSLARTDLLILDDWGPEKLNDEQRRDLLEIVEDRYERRSTIITSQIPVDHWYDMIGNATIADAILDRLVHNAYRIELSGESLRKQRAVSISDTTVA